MNNIEYIRNWYLDNNKYLKEENNKEEKLNILVFYTIAFEKLSGIDTNDKIIVNNGIINCTSTNKENNDIEKILKMINIEYAYLSYEELENTAGYQYIKESEIEGEIDNQTINDYLSDIYNSLTKRYQNYNFNKHIYKINNKIFFSVNELNEEEINQLYEINDSNQTLYEIFHDEEGKMRIY